MNDIKILKFGEKDIVDNIKIIRDREIEVLTNCSNVFSMGDYFYIAIDDTDRVFDIGLKGEWLL